MRHVKVEAHNYGITCAASFVYIEYIKARTEHPNAIIHFLLPGSRLY